MEPWSSQRQPQKGAGGQKSHPRIRRFPSRCSLLLPELCWGSLFLRSVQASSFTRGLQDKAAPAVRRGSSEPPGLCFPSQLSFPVLWLLLFPDLVSVKVLSSSEQAPMGHPFSWDPFFFSHCRLKRCFSWRDLRESAPNARIKLNTTGRRN